MNTKWMGVLVCLVVSLLVGCGNSGVGLIPIKGSGTPKTVTYDTKDFSALEIRSAFQVTLKQGAAFAISITMDDNLVPHLQTEKEGDTFKLGMKPGSYNTTVLKAEITMPTVTRIRLSGSSNLVGSGFKDLKDLEMHLSGSSKIALSGGNAGASKVKLSGSSDAELLQFPLKEADLTLSGSSKAELQVSDKLDYTLSGSSKLHYQGSPAIGRKESSGSSKIEKK